MEDKTKKNATTGRGKKIFTLFLVVALGLQYFLFSFGYIKPYVNYFAITTGSASIGQSETTKVILKAQCIPFYAKKDIAYAVDDASIATVTADGTIKGVTKGTATIKATWGSHYAQATIQVLEQTLMTFAQGSYRGEIIDGKRDGYGTMFYENGNVYEGYWTNDIINGFGQMIWENKNRYDGHWKNEQFDGFGRLERKSDYTYIGDWLEGQFHGYGIMVWANGNTYEGNWKLGQIDGYGTFKWRGRDSYSGDWKDGKREGYGLYTYNRNENEYIGDWKDNAKDGYGIETRSGKRLYEGHWKKDMFFGFGKQYTNGELSRAAFFTGEETIK